MAIGKRFSNDEVRRYIESRNCIWVSGEYKNEDSFLSIKFKCGHTCDVRYGGFRNGTRCKICSREKVVSNQRLSQQKVIDLVKSYGYEFIEFIGEYKNNKTEIKYRCNWGHETIRKYGVFRINPHCAECERVKRKKSHTNDMNYVLSIISSYNCEYVDGTYRNKKSELLIKFPCGHLEQIKYHLFIMRNNELCPSCTKEKKFNEQRKPQEDVINLVVNNGFKFDSFVEKYTGNVSKIKYICELGHENITTIGNFMTDPHCIVCKKIRFIESKTGENSNWWRGGKSKITSFFRHMITDWYKSSLKRCNYLCQISGKRAKTVHHLYPFYQIVQDVFNELNIEIKPKVTDYSKEELEILGNKFLELHNQYDGIPLTKSIHDLFHKLYSKNNFTEQDFYDFKSRIASGEIQIPA